MDTESNSSKKLIELAKVVQAIEVNYKTDEKERTYAIASALLDCIDYALDQGIIFDFSENLPSYTNKYLASSYAYLGDPL